MRLKQFSAYLAALPLIGATTGCDPATISVVLSDPEVQKVVGDVATNVAMNLVVAGGKAVIDWLSTPAQAETVTPAQAAPRSEEQRQRDVSANVAVVTTANAIEQSGKKKEDGSWAFDCERGEQHADCVTRLQKNLTDSATARAGALFVAFADCRETTRGIDIVHVVDGLNACVSDKGFKAEVIALLSPKNAPRAG
jgi:hypothetical protein